MIFSFLFFKFSLSVLNNSPYGVCAHITRDEYLENPKILDKIKEAGIGWVRSDIDMYIFNMNESHYDSLLDDMDRHGLSLLPIIAGFPKDMSPPINHLDAWAECLKRIVTKFQSRLTYWEIMNEPNLPLYWETTPSASSFRELLKKGYETIKQVNQSLIMLYAGVAGPDMEYITESFKNGGINYFDIMNFHMYRPGLSSFIEISKFNETIYNVSAVAQHKPVWITEMGFNTFLNKEKFEPWLFKTLFSLLPNTHNYVKVKKVGYLYGDGSFEDVPGVTTHLLRKFMTEAVPNQQLEVEAIDFDYYFDGKHALEDEYQMVVVPPIESFPEHTIEYVRNFVKNGGTLVFLMGIPVYFNSNRTEVLNYDLRHSLRIPSTFFWNNPEVPETSSVEFDSSFPNEMRTFDISTKEGHRFFDDSLLHEGDRMIRVANSKTNSKYSTIFLYDFNSDMKGNIFVSTHNPFLTCVQHSLNTEREQAVYTPQNYFFAYRFGVERFFNFEFRSTEDDPEDTESFYGIVHRDLSEKPAYSSVKAMTKARPDGSIDFKDINYREEDHIKFKWLRPDGSNGFAFWFPTDIEKKLYAKVDGTVTSAFNLYGEPIAIPKTGDQVVISQEITYLIGANDITLTKQYVEPLPETSSSTNGQNKNKKNKTGLIVGVSIACVALIVSVAAIAIIIHKRRMTDKSENKLVSF